jgi:hypothetical protein
VFISHKYKAIFVHIQRTGGNSVQKVFADHDPDLIEAVPVDPAKKRTKHCFASDIRAAIEPATFAAYTKFAVVRNPYERMASWYFHLTDDVNDGDADIQLKRHPRLLDAYHLGLKAIARTRFTAAYTDAWLRVFRWLKISAPNSGEEMALRFGSIGEQVRREVARHAPTFADFIRLPREHPSGIFERFHVNQLDYLADGDALLVDRVLRFERLDADFADFARAIGFPGRLPHVNRSSRKAAHHAYYDDATRAITAARFRRDLDRFAYAF